MEGRKPGKPYRKAVANYPCHKKEIDELPRKYDTILARYPYKNGPCSMDEADFFMELVLCCEEFKQLHGKAFLKRVCSTVEAHLCEERQKARKLYNPYRNLFLDKCYGDSKTPLVDWINFDKEEE